MKCERPLHPPRPSRAASPSSPTPRRYRTGAAPLPSQGHRSGVRLPHEIVLPHFSPCNPSGKIYTGPIAIPPNPRIFLSAGEAIGDHYGAQLLTELRRRLPQLTCFGLGGKEMADAALYPVVPPEHVPHIALPEPLLPI